MAELKAIKRDIAETKAKLKKAEVGKKVKAIERLENLLIEQQREKNILLARESSSASAGAPSL
jgi:hypothetical protein